MAAAQSSSWGVGRTSLCHRRHTRCHGRRPAALQPPAALLQQLLGSGEAVQLGPHKLSQPIGVGTWAWGNQLLVRQCQRLRCQTPLPLLPRWRGLLPR